MAAARTLSPNRVCERACALLTGLLPGVTAAEDLSTVSRVESRLGDEADSRDGEDEDVAKDAEADTGREVEPAFSGR